MQIRQGASLRDSGHESWPGLDVLAARGCHAAPQLARPGKVPSHDDLLETGTAQLVHLVDANVSRVDIN